MTSYGTRVASPPIADEVKVEVQYAQIGLLSIRFLGPERFWGGDTKISNRTRSQIQDLIRETCNRTGDRLAGYFIDTDSDSLLYHMTSL